MRVSAHSYDGMDWAGALERLRRFDELTSGESRELARRLLAPRTRVVVDVGSGAGGMGAAFAGALPPDSTVVLVDATPELLEAAAADTAAAAAPGVRVRTVRADGAGDELARLAPGADLVFASLVTHHLPDQQRGVDRLAGLARPGGRVALVEFGLEQRCMPWDVGVGEPGLQERLLAARGEWFRHMRAGMEGAVRMPYGWPRALAEAGLGDVGSFTYLIDKPAPPTEAVRAAVLRWLSDLREGAGDRLAEPDLHAVDQLLDADGPHYVGRRDDVFVLVAHTVHLGTAPA